MPHLKFVLPVTLLFLTGFDNLYGHHAVPTIERNDDMSEKRIGQEISSA